MTNDNLFIKNFMGVKITFLPATEEIIKLDEKSKDPKGAVSFYAAQEYEASEMKDTIADVKRDLQKGDSLTVYFHERGIRTVVNDRLATMGVQAVKLSALNLDAYLSRGSKS